MFNINKNLITRSNKRCFNYRSRILQLSQKVGALHIGGSFSSVDSPSSDLYSKDSKVFTCLIL